MKKTRLFTLIGIALLSIVLITSAYAQMTCKGGSCTGCGGKMRKKSFNKQQRGERMMTGMTKKLNLSVSQQNQIRNIFTNYNRKFTTLKGNKSLGKEQKMAQAKEMHMSMDKEIRSVLNADQRRTWDEMKKQRMERRKNRQNWKHKGVKKGSTEKAPAVQHTK